jgi:hypothetical protein
MSQRIQIALPDPIAHQLRELAGGTGEPLATLAGQMVRNSVALAAKDGNVRALRQAPALVRRTGSERAPWLAPYGGDRVWRQEMWGQVVALHGRYPRHLGDVKDGWWTDEAHTETLCALATWRAELDDAGLDPRDELAFHTHLSDYRHTLRQAGGAVTKEWKPGAPPEEWIAS